MAGSRKANGSAIRYRTATGKRRLSDGVTAPFMLDGPMDGPHFLPSYERFIAPILKKEQIVFLNNVSTHKVDGVEEASRLAVHAPFSCHLTARISISSNNCSELIVPAQNQGTNR